MTSFNQNLFYSDHNKTVSISTSKFPAGEVGVQVNASSLCFDEGWITITSKALSSDILMQTFMATDALRRNFPRSNIKLYIPYLPYARQDRVCNEGESLSVAVMAKLINAMEYNSVVIVDPHSSVTPALLDNCQVVKQEDVFCKIKTSFLDTYIVSPDMGASKKAEAFCKKVGAKGVVYANKTRDLLTGKILDTGLIGDYQLYGSNLLVLDDICDGGRTFIELAKLLIPYKPNTLELAVTHGVFSKGLDELTRLYSRVYTSDSLPQVSNSSLTVVKIKN